MAAESVDECEWNLKRGKERRMSNVNSGDSFAMESPYCYEFDF